MTASRTGPGRRHYDLVKRYIDLVIAAFALIVTSPVQLVVAVLIRVKMGRPILFRQRRPGRFGRPFTLVKFRTMIEPNPGRGITSDSDRLTPLGRVLRTTSIDELPTLWNVIRGDMSLVGPRPLLMQYLDRYTPAQARRHEVRPGITGLAQVSGRNLLGWEDRFAVDVEYIERRSLQLDIRILARTVSSVVLRHGISEHGEATMSEFRPAMTPTAERS